MFRACVCGVALFSRWLLSAAAAAADPVVGWRKGRGRGAGAVACKCRSFPGQAADLFK